MDPNTGYLWGQAPPDTEALKQEAEEFRRRKQQMLAERRQDDADRIRRAEEQAQLEQQYRDLIRQRNEEDVRVNEAIAQRVGCRSGEAFRRARLAETEVVYAHPSDVAEITDEPNWADVRRAKGAQNVANLDVQAREMERRRQLHDAERRDDEQRRLYQLQRQTELDNMAQDIRRQIREETATENMQMATRHTAQKAADSARQQQEIQDHNTAWAHSQLMDPQPEHQRSSANPNRVNPQEFKTWGADFNAQVRSEQLEQIEEHRRAQERAKAEAEAQAIRDAQVRRSAAQLEYEARQARDELEHQREEELLKQQEEAQAHFNEQQVARRNVITDEFWGAFGTSRR